MNSKPVCLVQPQDYDRQPTCSLGARVWHPERIRERWVADVEHGREFGLDSTLEETFPCSDPLSSIPNPQLQRG